MLAHNALNHYAIVFLFYMKLLLRLSGIGLGLLCQVALAAATILWMHHRDFVKSETASATQDWTASLRKTFDSFIGGGDSQQDATASSSSPLNQVLSKPLPQPLSPQVRTQTQASYADLLKRHSEMALPEKQLAETENGLLQWLNFEERVPASYRNLGLSKALELAATGQADYQAADAKKWVESNRAWLDAILTVGSYADQSIHGVATQRRRATTDHAEFAYRCAAALLLKARVAADANDAATALASVRAANGLASHFDRIEAPSFFEYSVGTTIRLNVAQCAITTLIPQLMRTNSVDFAQWQQTLANPATRPADISRCYVGEWQLSLQNTYLPAFIANRSLAPSLPFPEILDAYSRIINRCVSQAESSPDWASWWSKTNAAPTQSEILSPAAREFSTLIETTLTASHKTWLRSVLRHSQYQAALKQLQREAVPNAGIQPVVGDPLTGTPWLWDATSRTFITPNDPLLLPFAIEPLKLP